MGHTILLMQLEPFPESRIFFDYETISDCLGSICRIYEKSISIEDSHQDIENYDILQLYNFIDGLHDCVCLVHQDNSNTYEPHPRNWIKEQLYKQLILHEYI
ncbi:hypothetical protein KR222_009976 [Zaprionus bogoriensis]|nr:hypothetical protein KR222_009976 [Zaprionus bogoriensis]